MEVEYKCIIFDCDGVLVDSESITAKVFVKMAAELDFELDYEIALEKFTGTSMKENLQFIEDHIEVPMPASFEEDFRKRSFEAFKNEIQPIAGVPELINKISVPICVASSGPVPKIKLNLSATGLIEKFNGNIFSCYEINSWKPDPGIYLHAAKQMGFAPEECVVVEDSPSGVRAAVAGGFKVYALANAANEDKLERMGAITFREMKELGSLLKL